MISRAAHKDDTPATTPEGTDDSTPKIPVFNVSTTTEYDPTEPTKPKGRLLNMNIEDVHAVANAIHNQTHHDSKKKTVMDLSDVSLDDEDDDITKYAENDNIADKFFGGNSFPNTQVPTNPSADESQDDGFCKENVFTYKPGDHIKRGCEEICECVNGKWACHPRCQHPYIRRGRKLDDPLCFESPIDECCSIIACAADTKVSTTTSQGVGLCRFGNDTHSVGSTWNVGCEQTCVCEKNSIVSCKPRCPKLMASDKCINVPDPKDACCEMQVCDVSQDAHEESADNFTAAAVADKTKSDSSGKSTATTTRPLVLAEPIAAVKVLQNNSVRVDLVHSNNTRDPIHLQMSGDGGKTYSDVQLRYPNVIENLTNGNYIIKTRETGVEFNFTIGGGEEGNVGAGAGSENVTSQMGCYHDGKLYAVGEEFHIGCAELCECTGPDTRDCAVLECPSHVGLELVSKGCVRWAPTPPPSPPDCCPRSARCLSDGTCHYNGHAIPNWSEVPLSLTGCEKRCFCENGELDCQDVCSELSLLPPQNFRCPPGHHPAHVNISYEDCCKEWGCVPNTGKSQALHSQTTENVMTYPRDIITLHNFRQQIPVTSIFVTQPTHTEPVADFVKQTHLIEVSSIPKIVKSANEKLASNGRSKENNLIEFNKLSDATITKAIPNTNINPMIDPHADIYSHSNEWKGLIRKNSRFLEENVKQNDSIKAYEQDASHKVLDYELNDNNPFVLKKMKTSNFNTLTTFDNSNKYTIAKNDHSLHPATNHVLSVEMHTQKNILSTYKLYNIADSTQTPTEKVLIEKNLKINAQKNYNKKEKTVTKVSNKTQPYLTTRSIPLHNIDTESTIDSKLLSSIIKKNKPDLNLEDGFKGVDSEVEGNPGHSAEKPQVALAGLNAGHMHPAIANLPIPGFLPTIPPELPFPHEDHEYNRSVLRPPQGPVIPTLRPIPIPGEENKKLTMISLQADSPTSVKMLFGLPPVLVGLRGSVDLRYTDNDDDDISRWQSQVFAPVDEILTTSRLEFRLAGLKPSTTYRLKGKLFLHSLPVEPESEIFSVKTQDLPLIEEKHRDIDSQLTVVEVNDTTARLSWRHFADDELPFIDGIQVRYRPVGQPIYTMTELLHHSRSNADLKELRPGSRYEASLVLVPPMQAATELRDLKTVEFTTAPHIDPYDWSVIIEANTVGSQAAELHWHGIPEPAERWVRVYRAAHECGTGRAQEHDAFKLATRDQSPVITITGLKADTRCRVWLELFLVNGKVKTSNVLEITTKSLDSDHHIDSANLVADQTRKSHAHIFSRWRDWHSPWRHPPVLPYKATINTIEASSVAGARDAHATGRGDYYGALVVVGVVAALGALASLLLLLVVIRRHRPHSVPITPVPTVPRDSTLPPYDNPAYKLELQQETMGTLLLPSVAKHFLLFCSLRGRH
ncbi:Putative epidermal cell surface receptor [Eumeta japonica]|uniref:Epidermal cell surface receptor n=1 Tax=Eumeta variegata TaxID=151549 RepID=A0A4C1TG14_EUMVA|nr:Putative epidermal cell surface receptor [Eumeta japonica]